jgi:hypothetical protein
VSEHTSEDMASNSKQRMKGDEATLELIVDPNSDGHISDYE